MGTSLANSIHRLQSGACVALDWRGQTPVSRNYLDWPLAVTWKKKSKEIRNIEHAEKILNRDPYGMEKIKFFPKRRFRKALSARWRVGAWLGFLLVLCHKLFLVAGFLAAGYY